MINGRVSRGRKLTAFVVALAMVLAGIVMPDPVSAASKPAKVKKLTATAISYNAVKLKWKKAKRAKTYHVYISTGGKYKYKKKTRFTSCTIKKLKGNKNYWFKVRALRGKKKGKKSKAAYAKTYCKVAFVYKYEKNDSVRNKKKISSVRQGKSASAPKVKTKLTDGTYSYKFTNWNKSFNNIQSNKTITAKYDVDVINEIASPKEKKATDEENKKELLKLINNYRVQNGLNELILHEGLSKVAQQRCQEMIDGYFDYDHHSIVSGDPSTAVMRAGLFPIGTSENATYGNNNAKEAFNSWKISPQHNHNMLDPKHNYIGIGVNDGVYFNIFARGFENPPTNVTEYAYYNCSKCKKRQRIVQDYSTDYWTCPDCKTVNKKAW